MILFLDTEFTGLGQANPSLISLALVKEDGDFFYAELPPATYQHRADPWVRDNVLPLLWGGSYRMLPEELSAKLTAWIEAVAGRTTIVTDSPEYDFDMMLAPLLDPWPPSLARQALRFDSYAMGTDRQAWLSEVMGRFRDAERPEHHALYDALALREGMTAARGAGWTPGLAWLDAALSPSDQAR
jgi:DNA polymerase III epsilon subunit-like protein